MCKFNFLAACARRTENTASAKSSALPRGRKTRHSCKTQRDQAGELLGFAQSYRRKYWPLSLFSAVCCFQRWARSLLITQLVQYKAHNVSRSMISPPPNLTSADATALLYEQWDLRVSTHPLTAERDQNFLISVADKPKYVLKVSNPDEKSDVGNLQTAALIHLAKNGQDLPTPRIIPSKNGEFEVEVEIPDGRTAMARLITVVRGAPLNGSVISPEIAADLGKTLGRIDLVLADFEHPAANHDLLWDIRKLPEMEGALAHVQDRTGAIIAGKLLTSISEEVLPALKRLPKQVIHNDLNLHNAFSQGAEVSGVIDFGDMIEAQRVIDPATLCSYLICEDSNPFRLARMAAQSYHKTFALLPEELSIIPDLVVARSLLTILITSERAERFPVNAAYILRNQKLAWFVLELKSNLGDEFTNHFWGTTDV